MNRTLGLSGLLLLTACSGAKERGLKSVPQGVIQTKTWSLFPPDWQVGDAWEVESTTSQVDPKTFGLHEVTRDFVYRVVETPTRPDGDYVLHVEASDGDPSDPYTLVFRGRDLSCLRVERHGDGHPQATQPSVLWGREGEPFISVGLGAQIVLDFPVRPDPAQPWALLDLTTGSSSAFESHRTQQMVYDGIGVTFELKLQKRELTYHVGARVPEIMGISATIRWKQGDPWWSQIEHYEGVQPVGPPTLSAHARLIRVLRYAAGNITPPEPTR